MNGMTSNAPGAGKGQDMENKIKETQKRLIRYDYVDGTPDLAFGGLCLTMTICFSIFAAIPGLGSSTFSAIIVWVVLGGGGLLVGWLSQRVKAQVTYARTGYVALSRQGRPIKRDTQLLIRIGAPLLSLVLLGLLFLNRQKFPAQSQDTAGFLNPGLMGLFFSGLFAIMAWKIPLKRYYLVAAAIFVASTTFFISRWGGNPGMASLSALMSLILFISGGMTLWRYLHQNPGPREMPDEQ
jgi:hypothetical protein